MDLDLFKDVYNGKKVVITGCTGFKGSWLALWLKELGAKVYGYSLKPLHPEDNYNTVQLSKKIHSEYHDILDAERIKSFFKIHQPDFAFHLAAQPLVLTSYQDSAHTFAVNVQGTVNFMEAVRSCPSCKAAIVVTSDKCYDNKEWVWGYRESDAMGGSDPYSASKGCAELVTSSYTKSFFNSEGTCHIASVRAGNVIGGGDWAEYRIVPDLFRAIKNKQKLLLRNPSAIRPWQFVLEPLYGYLKVGEKLWEKGKDFSGAWNFGPGNSNYSVLELISLLVRKLDLDENIVEYNQGSPKLYEANFLKLDISKAVHLLEWKPVLEFFETVNFTVKSYQNVHYTDRVEQIAEYVSLARKHEEFIDK